MPINLLVKVEGTPLASGDALDPIDFVRTIAVARITMPKSVVRLSAGREDMSEETQRCAFMRSAFQHLDSEQFRFAQGPAVPSVIR